MADVQKTVEETPVVPAAETAVETAPEATAEAPTEAAETTATPAVENEAAEPAKEEVKPATEGVLGYKGPGLVKGLRFAKRFFYFSEEAVESKQLSVFHQNEKPATANPTAAWASQTGKGLLFLTKRAEDKAHPAGIFNLADVSDVTKDGHNEFVFKVGGHKHTFQASSAAERDSWVVAIEANATEAKAEKETITSSEGYKAELEKLTKPAVVVAAAAKKLEEKKEETPAEAGESAKEEPKEEKKEEKITAAKSRSQSRKRTSIFGSLLGKKDAEEKKEETPAAEEPKAAEPAAETAVEAAAPVAAAETAETAPAPAEVVEPTVETPAEATETVEETPKEEAKEEKKKEEKKDEKKSKRASIFGNFFQKVASPSQEKSEKEATVPAVEETPVASTAPQLESPVEEAAVKPVEPESVTAPAADETAVVETSAAEPVSSPKEKRRTSFFGNLGMKKEKKAESSDNEVTDGEAKEAKHKNKLGGLFRKPSKAVKLDKEEVAATETEVKADAAEDVSAVPAKETATEEASAAVEETRKAAETVPEDAKNVSVAAATPVQAAA